MAPIHPSNYRTLQSLVEVYSPTLSERAAVEYLVERMQALGYTRAFVDAAGNAVGVLGVGPRQVVLLGHIDTVSGEIPVRVETVEDRQVLYGRGAIDAKGPLAAFTDAAARVGAQDGWQIVVIGAVEEEGDSSGARFVKDQYRPEFAIIGEPSGWERVTLGYKGSAWAEVGVRLPQMHTAGKGQSACEVAFDIWRAVLARVQVFNDGRERVFDQVLPALRGFESSEDGFEMRAKLRLGTRLPPDLPPEAWYALLEDILHRFADLNIQMTTTGFAIPAHLCEKNTPLVRAFLAGIRSAGGQPGFVLKTGTADLNIVAPAWNCPAVAYGPGDSSLDHTPNEHIVLQEYISGVEVLSSTLIRLCQTS